MEKLILRSIMYGADKIPDSWFEKVPGGFYKGSAQEISDKSDKSDKSKSAKSPPSSSTSRAQAKGRRNSTGGLPPSQSSRREGRDRERDRGRERERERERDRDRTSKTSYDGHADEQQYDDYQSSASDPRERERKARRYRRARSGDDGRGAEVRERDQRDQRGGQREWKREQDRHLETGTQYTSPTYTESPSSSTTAFSPPPPPTNAAMPPPPMPSHGYVPYADIYGPPQQQQRARNFSNASSTSQLPHRPRGPSNASVTSTNSAHLPPVAPPPGSYQQNPYAQLAPTAAAAGAGAAYTGQAGYLPQGGRRESFGPTGWADGGAQNKYAHASTATTSASPPAMTVDPRRPLGQQLRSSTMPSSSK